MARSSGRASGRRRAGGGKKGRGAPEGMVPALSASVGPGGPAGGVLARLRGAGLLPRKRLGQHFLHDPALLGCLAEESGIGPEDRVLEVGTGPGTLTAELARRAREVLTLEIDPALRAFASEELSPFSNVRIEGLDILPRGKRLAPEALPLLASIEPFVWVSNLPYNLATTLMVAVLESPLRWRSASLLVQEEVAARLAAAPGGRAWGPTTALVAYWAEASLGRRVAPGSFWPPPKVDSRVLHLRPRAAPLGAPEEYPGYRDWVRVLFASRRKQLRGILRRALSRPPSAPRSPGPIEGSPGGGLGGALGDWLEGRPESLPPGQILALSRLLGAPVGFR